MNVDLTMPGPLAMSFADSIAGRLGGYDAQFLLANRAEYMGLRAHGHISAGGSCRLMQAGDGWVAVNLARPSDVEVVGAVVETNLGDTDPWAALEQYSRRASSQEVVDRCQLLGVPAAVLDDPAVHSSQAVTRHEIGEPSTKQTKPRVLDLSSMWAGPLCAHLLGRNGMEVLQVECRQRPVGARFGNADFFEWLHAGHGEVVLDFESVSGRDQLANLVSASDVVIEASRARALRHLGVDPTSFLARQKGKLWISITGYGRSGARDNWIAFGDDAAIAGGLVAEHHAGPSFVADAVADPLTGLLAADAALGSWAAGGGVLLEIRMASVAKKFAEMDRR